METELQKSDKPRKTAKKTKAEVEPKKSTAKSAASTAKAKAAKEKPVEAPKKSKARASVASEPSARGKSARKAEKAVPPARKKRSATRADETNTELDETLAALPDASKTLPDTRLHDGHAPSGLFPLSGEFELDGNEESADEATADVSEDDSRSNEPDGGRAGGPRAHEVSTMLLPEGFDIAKYDPDYAARLAGFRPDSQAIAAHVGRLSDRAIQRLVGGNAFLRGRQYARRGEVTQITLEDSKVSAQLSARQDTYQPQVLLDGVLRSECTCAGFRGPTGHCKHVAALLVALRDRQRPPKPRLPPEVRARLQSEQSAFHVESQTAYPTTGFSQFAPNPRREDPRKDDRDGDLLRGDGLQTVSVGGKRRRGRRRGREVGSTLNILQNEKGPREEPAKADPWLPTDEEYRRPLDVEFRMVVKPSGVAITPMIAGTRTALPIENALASWNGVASNLRPVLRTLLRHASRGATAELRGEDVSEVLQLLVGRRVLLDPASMELRFSDDALRPRIELDQTTSRSCRVRVVFESKNGRRFPLSNGAWFEGTPGYHIDTTEGVARPLAESVTPAWLQKLCRSPALMYPMEELPRLLSEYIPKVSLMLAAELPDLGQVGEIIDAPAQFRVQLEGDILHAEAKLLVRYVDAVFVVPPKELPSPIAVLEGEENAKPRIVRRDVGAEISAITALRGVSFVPSNVLGREDFLVSEGESAVQFWTQGITTLPEEWEKLIPADLQAIRIRDQAVAPQMRVGSGVDWLSLDLTFLSDGIAVDQDELRNCLLSGKRLVKLKDGSYAPVRAEEVAQVLERMAEIVAGADPGKIPLSQAGRIQDLLQVVNSQSVTQEAKALFGKFEDIGEIELVARPRNLKVEQFRDYQRRGFSWLVFLHNMKTGGILADDMGLGKTLQTIALLLWCKSTLKKAASEATSLETSADGEAPVAQKRRGPMALVVAPTSVVPNWAREIEKFAPSLSTLLWQGTSRHDQKEELDSVDVMITSYALLRRDEELLQSYRFHYVILDEAQHIKNPFSATARAAKKMDSDRRLALTGTPIENRLSEIWSIMDFVSPGVLGSLKHFEEKYARPIERGEEETVQKLRTIVRPLVMRRTKEEVAPELPEKIEQEMIVPMSEEQQKLYKQMLAQIRAALLSEVEKQGVGKSQLQILAALTRLRQAACDPRLTKLNGQWSDETSGKLQALREIVAEATAGGHRILIFSQFVEMLSLIRAALDSDGVKYNYLDGSTKDRQKVVDSFNDDESVQAFLISLKAGGTGLNLTGADTVIHFDPWWNPAVEDQATDRAHRIGQKKVVNVYRLIAKGSVEEKILSLSGKKRSLMENVLSTEGTPMKGLTEQDVDDLFSET